MIEISGNVVKPENIIRDYANDATEQKIIDLIAESTEEYNYESMEQLKFEIKMRKEIINSALELNESDMGFATFRKSKCNLDFWNRTDEGGFVLKDGVKFLQTVQSTPQNVQLQ